MSTTLKAKPRKPTGYAARPWLKLVPRAKVTTDNRARLYLPSGDVVLDQRVLASPVTMSLDEAATVTFSVADPAVDLSTLALAKADEAGLLSGIDMRWRGLWWRITRIDRDDQGWQIVAEDRVAAYLRSHKRLVTASRGSVTRAQFVHRLTKGVKAGGGIPVYIPELSEKQGIYKLDVPKARKTAKSASTDTSEMDGADGDAMSGGWGDAASKVKVKRETANKEQLDTINTVLATAQELGANRRVMIACVMTVTQESNAGMEMGGNSTAPDVRGAFQQRTWQYSGWTRSERSALDVAASTKRFLLGGDLGAPGWKKKFGSVTAGAAPGQTPLGLGGMINLVQVAGPDAVAEFGQWEGEATKTVDLWLDRNQGGGAAPGTGGGDPADEHYRGEYKFRTSDGEPLNWWDASGELANEVQWHRWAVSNTLGFATDDEMIRGNPVLQISRGAPGVGKLRWTWDKRREASEFTCTVVLQDPFQILPGMVAMVDDDQPVSGRWLVESVEVDPCAGNIAEVVFRRRGAKLLEPAPELKQGEPKSRIGGGDYGVFGDDDEDSSGEPGGKIKSLRGKSPRQIINEEVLTVARACGVQVTAVTNDAANARHGPTSSGNRSDHQGPGDYAWAADMSNGSSPTPQMDKLAHALADKFGLKRLSLSVTGAGNKSSQDSKIVRDGFAIQLIYRSTLGGDHDNHVHFGLHRV